VDVLCVVWCVRQRYDVSSCCGHLPSSCGTLYETGYPVRNCNDDEHGLLVRGVGVCGGNWS